MVLLAVMIGLVRLLLARDHANRQLCKFFDFIPSSVIHNLGVIGMVIVAVTGLAGACQHVRQVRRRECPGDHAGVRHELVGGDLGDSWR